MVSTRGRLLVLGGNPLHGSDALDSRMGACLWDLSLGQHTGDVKPDGRRFWVGRGCFFLGGAGEGKRNSRARNAETMRRCFAGRCEFQTACLCYILYIAQWKFRCIMRKDIAKGVLDPRLPWADTVAVRLRQPVDLVHALKTVKVLLLLGPPRTPRSSGYDF